MHDATLALLGIFVYLPISVAIIEVIGIITCSYSKKFILNQECNHIT